jgi:hypothetical protein
MEEEHVHTYHSNFLQALMQNNSSSLVGSPGQGSFKPVMSLISLTAGAGSFPQSTVEANSSLQY